MTSNVSKNLSLEKEAKIKIGSFGKFFLPTW